MKKFKMSDGQDNWEVEAESAKAAIADTDISCYGTGEKTIWVTISATEILSPEISLIWGNLTEIQMTMLFDFFTEKIDVNIDIDDNLFGYINSDGLFIWGTKEKRDEAEFADKFEARSTGLLAHVVFSGIDDEGDTYSEKMTIDPEEPPCDAMEHQWESPEWLGGLKENPGVWGHGGGVVVREVCRCCGAYRISDSFAQDPYDGEQGLYSMKYEEADEQSLEWVSENQE